MLNAFMLITSCADPHFMDRTQLEGSILMGNSVDPTDPIAARTVLIGQNFEFQNSKIQYFGLCSGVLINTDTVLTAAHCINDFKTSRVVTTQNAHSGSIQPEQIYKIRRTVIHEGYSNPKNKDKDPRYDIALIRLERKVENMNYDSSYLISIPTTEYINKSTWSLLKAYIAGFGKNSIDESGINDDKSVLQPINGILEKAEVKISNEQYQKQAIIIDQKEKAGACSGDSGGPLFILRDEKLYLQGLAIAVVSTASNSELTHKNACNNKSYYLNLDFYKDWISQALAQLSIKKLN